MPLAILHYSKRSGLTLPNNNNNNTQQSQTMQNIPCRQEARLTAIETRLENKKESIHEVHDDYYHLRDKLEVISTNVVELTTLMREAQKKEDENDKKIDEMNKEIGTLKVNIANLDKKIEKTNSSLETIKWLVPVICAILTFIVNYLI